MKFNLFLFMCFTACAGLAVLGFVQSSDETASRIKAQADGIEFRLIPQSDRG